MNIKTSPPMVADGGALQSEIALEGLPISDRVRIYFTMRARHLPASLAREIQNDLAAVCLRSYSSLSIVAFVGTAVLAGTLLSLDRPIAQIWIGTQLLIFASLFVVIRRLRSLSGAGMLTARAVNIHLAVPTALSGIAWGNFPAAVGIESAEAYYLAVTVTTCVCALGFFWTLAHWPMSNLFAALLLICVHINAVVLGAYGTASIAITSPVLLGALIAMSLIASRDLVDSRGRSAIAREHQQLLDLLLKDYERGGHDFLWETDANLNLTHVPPRMTLAGHGDPTIAEGANLLTIVRSDREALDSIGNDAPFQARVTTKGPDGIGELRLWGRPKIIGGECLGYSGVGSDEDAARRAAHAEVTSERLDAIVAVTSGLAHDFNNQLATILGAVELASLDPTISESGRGHIRRAIEGVMRTRSLTADLALTSGNNATYHPSIVDVGETIDAVIDDVAPHYPAINLRSHCPDTVHAVADTNHFERALRNLVEHACASFVDINGNSKAVEDRTPNVLVHAVAAAESPRVSRAQIPMVEISVIDNGPGVPAELSNMVFEPYKSQRRTRGGSGLGLAVARGFAQQANGTLELAPTSNGTKFKMRLPEPTILPEANDQPLVQVGRAALPSNWNLDGLFFVVEDDRHVANTMTKAITAFGGRVEVVHSVAAAKARFRQVMTDIECVICDLVLPDGEGYEVISALRQHSPTTRAVYVSGFTRNLPATVAPELRCPFVPKPFSSDELLHGLLSAGVRMSRATLESSPSQDQQSPTDTHQTYSAA